MQKYFISIALFTLLLNVWSCQTTKNEAKSETKPVTEAAKTSNYTYKIVEGENHTFGYEISSQGTVLVRQPFIPAVAGKQGFVSKEEAESVAKLIVQKVEKNIIPPAISIKELDSLKIHYTK